MLDPTLPCVQAPTKLPVWKKVGFKKDCEMQELENATMTADHFAEHWIG
jgi:hypothetical protein